MAPASRVTDCVAFQSGDELRRVQRIACRTVQLSGPPFETETAQRQRALAGLKGYVTNLRACPDGTPVTPEFVIGAYHQLFQIE